MDQLVEPDRREELRRQGRESRRSKLREQGPEPEARPDRRRVRPLGRAHRHSRCPTPPFWGVREIAVDLDEVYPHLDTHVLFKLHWGGRGVKGEEWRQLVDEDFRPRLERMWAEQDYLHPRALLGYFPCNSVGNALELYDPEDPEKRARDARLPAPARPRPDLPRRLLPPDRTAASATSSRSRP